MDQEIETVELEQSLQDYKPQASPCILYTDPTHFSKLTSDMSRSMWIHGVQIWTNEQARVSLQWKVKRNSEERERPRIYIQDARDPGKQKGVVVFVVFP
jgi:hypothetical protein